METDLQPWLPIETAPLDRGVELKGRYYPSQEAARNGAIACDVFGYGRALWATDSGHFWSGILNGNPTHWREKP